MDEKIEQIFNRLTADYSGYMGVKYSEDDFEAAAFLISHKANIEAVDQVNP